MVMPAMDGRALVEEIRSSTLCDGPHVVPAAQLTAPADTSWIAPALAQRRAQRQFGAAPVPLQPLEEVIAHGCRFAADLGAGNPSARQTIVVGADNVEGLQPGIYSYPAWDCLADRGVDDLVLPDQFRDIAASIHICVDLSILARDVRAGHLYRLMLADAGSALLSMWVRAESLGLGACMAARPQISGFRAIEPNDVALRPLATLVVGTPMAERITTDSPVAAGS